MGWWKRVDLADRLIQSVWFYVAAIFAGLTGGLVILGRATEAFLQWAPLSYGIIVAFTLPLALWAGLPLRKLITPRESRTVRLGRQAQSHADAIISTLRSEHVFGITPQVYYQSVAFLLELEKQGFATPILPQGPNVRVALEALGHYLSTIAPILMQGYRAEAKMAAAHISAPAPTAPQVEN